MSYDDILTHIGEFGPYQRLITLLIILFTSMDPAHIMSVVFSMDTPEFRCAVPGLVNDTFKIQNLEHEQLVNRSIPYNAKSGKFSDCSSFTAVPTVSGFEFEENRTQDCDRWVYSTKVYETSIIADLNLVCDRQIYRAHTNLMIMLGLFVGSLVGGTLSDIFGRRKMIFTFGVIHWALGVSFVFMSSVPSLLAFKFMFGMCAMGITMGAFVLGVEITGPSRRSVAGLGPMFGWVLGSFIILPVFYFIRQWKTAHLVISTPTALLLVCLCFIPESPRWLFTKGRYEEAKEIMQKMARVNKKQWHQELFDQEVLRLQQCSSDEDGGKVSDPETTTTNQMSLIQLVKDKSVVVRILILCFNWAALNICYYGLAFNQGYLIAGNIYVNFAIQATMEGISYGGGAILLHKVGRARLYCSSIILGGLACLATMGPTLANSDKTWINAILSGLGKAGACVAFLVVYIFTSELLPTFARNSGLGICSCAGRIAGMVSPYIASLSMLAPGQFGKALPLIIFGGICVLSGLLALLLPETKDQSMPETTNDAHNLKWLKKEKEIGELEEIKKLKDFVKDEKV